jgi:hypothetical protein
MDGISAQRVGFGIASAVSLHYFFIREEGNKHCKIKV